MLVAKVLGALGRKRHHGFTLVELVIVVAMLAVLATLAAPGMTALVQAQRLRSASYDLTADLILARSEALKRATNVELVPEGGNWANGWTLQVVSPVTLLGQHGPLGGGITAAVSPVSNVTFNASGRVNPATDATTRVAFSIANAAGGTRCVQVDLSGRPKTTRSTC